LRSLLISALFLATAIPGCAQSTLAGRLGVANGVTGQFAASADLQVPITDKFNAMIEVAALASPGACAQSWPQSYRCHYGGLHLGLGGSFQIVTTGHVQVSALSTIGLFRPSDNWEPAVAVGIQPHVGIYRGISLSGSIRRLWIRDEFFETNWGEYPAITMLTLGLAVAL
jgi:hypothetical protein